MRLPVFRILRHFIHSITAHTHTENVDGHIQYAYGVASRLFLFVVVDVTIDASFVHYVHSSLGE